MKKHKLLTRSCVVCGLEKPLSAFLQLGNKKGAIYGTICGACRGSGLKEKVAHEDDASSTSAGMRIRAKERVDIIKQQKSDFQEQQIQHKEGTKKRDQISFEKTETRDEKDLALKRRDQKQSFLNYQTKIQQSLSAQSVLNQKKDDRLFTSVPTEKQQATEAVRKAETIKQEQKKTTGNLTGSPILDQQHLLNRDKLRAWLGADAPLMKTLSRLYTTVNPSQKSATERTEINKKETAREFMERTLGPASKKR